MSQADVMQAADQQEDFRASKSDMQKARDQAHLDHLNPVDLDEAQQQALAMKPNTRDAAAAAADAEADRLTEVEQKQAAEQSVFQPLSRAQQKVAAQQAEQHLQSMDAMRAMAQAVEEPLAKADEVASANQAQGMRYSAKIGKQAKVQAKADLFQPKVEDEVFAIKQDQADVLKPADVHAAEEQGKQQALKPWDAAVAKTQAVGPQLDHSAVNEAFRLSREPGYAGRTKAMAVKQAELDLLTGRDKQQAEAQVTLPENPKDMKNALQQAQSPELSTKDMKFAVVQAKKMFGMSKTQAVDTVTQLTAQVQLEALKQADDRLKQRDAARAKRQAKEVRLSLQDEWDAVHQAHDNELEHLSKAAEEYASKQIDGQFAGELTEENAKIATDLTTKALKKREKFLSGFEEWQEARREAKIRAKYALQRKILLGESQKDVHSKTPVKKTKPKPLKKNSAASPSGPGPALDIDAFHAKLKKIRNQAAHDVISIRQSTKTLMDPEAALMASHNGSRDRQGSAASNSF